MGTLAPKDAEADSLDVGDLFAADEGAEEAAALMMDDDVSAVEVVDKNDDDPERIRTTGDEVDEEEVGAVDAVTGGDARTPPEREEVEADVDVDEVEDDDGDREMVIGWW